MSTIRDNQTIGPDLERLILQEVQNRPHRRVDFIDALQQSACGPQGERARQLIRKLTEVTR